MVLLWLSGAALFFYWAYALFSVWAAWRWSRVSWAPSPDWLPAVTILKPVRGIDPEAYENFATFCRQDYPTDKVQILFGALDPNDPALALACRLQADFPHCDIQVIASAPEKVCGHNRKVCNLSGMLPYARHDLLVLCDSDMRVEPDYLRRITAPFARNQTPLEKNQKQVGMVTCPYRGVRPRGIASTLEGVSIGADFIPSTMVSRQIEDIAFGLGSTIALPRKVLEEIGGFEAIRDHLADDFLLGNATAKCGYEVVLSDYIVENVLGWEPFRAMWERRLRWMRTLRACRPVGYAGSVVTHGTPLALLFLLASAFHIAGWLALSATLALRLSVAGTIAARFTRDRTVLRGLALLLISDLLSFALFLCSYTGNHIIWRGERFRLLAGGRLERESLSETVSASTAP
jgi:ceramide glucosyltransferase